MPAWAKFPTGWIIQQRGLRDIVWKRHKSDGTAALLVLTALSVKRNRDKKHKPHNGDGTIVVATYEDIQNLIALSRLKISNGLALLDKLEVIERLENRSHYRIVGLDVPGGWAKLPQELLMQQQERIFLFDSFYLRSKSELDALKIYCLMLAFRSNTTGYAHIGYEKIAEYTGVRPNDLRKAKSHLISLGLIHSDLDFENAMDRSNPPLRYKILGLNQ